MHASAGVLTEKEFDQLLYSFYHAYEETATLPLEKSVVTFYRTFRRLKSLVRYSNYQEASDSQREKIIFVQTLKYFTEQISSG